jgi:hypothetical protein
LATILTAFHDKLLFTRVGTYVQRGSKFCFVVVLLLLGVTVIAQNIALLSNFTMHSAALPGSLAQQACPAVRQISTEFDARARSLARSAVTALLQWQVTKLHACAAVLTGLSLFLVQFHHAFINCMRPLLSAVQQTGLNLFICSYVDLFRSLLQVYYSNAGKD